MPLTERIWQFEGESSNDERLLCPSRTDCRCYMVKLFYGENLEWGRPRMERGSFKRVLLPEQLCEATSMVLGLVVVLG